MPGRCINPNKITIFLIPPANDDDEDEGNANLLKMAIQKKLDNKDLRLLTEMGVTIPMKTPELRYHIKNIEDV